MSRLPTSNDHTVDGSEIPRPTTWDGAKASVNNGIKTTVPSTGACPPQINRNPMAHSQGFVGSHLFLIKKLVEGFLIIMGI